MANPAPFDICHRNLQAKKYPPILGTATYKVKSTHPYGKSSYKLNSTHPYGIATSELKSTHPYGKPSYKL